MPRESDDIEVCQRHRSQFTTTHWNVVLVAGSGSPASAEALNQLCTTYREPILAYALGLGLGHADAEDVTQGFFIHFLQHDVAGRIERRTGVKFRSVLLRCFKNYLGDQRDRERAAKRGGGQEKISLDESAAGTAALPQLADGQTAECIYERKWASALLCRVLDRLESDYRARDRTAVFERLHALLLEKRGAAPYQELGRVLDMSEDAVKKEVSRMRQRYRELFREEIAHTVSRPEDIEDETRHLFAVLSG